MKAAARYRSGTHARRQRRAHSCDDRHELAANAYPTSLARAGALRLEAPDLVENRANAWQGVPLGAVVRGRRLAGQLPAEIAQQ